MAGSTPRRDDRVPRLHDKDDDYTVAMADERRRFATAHSGTPLDHVGTYSVEPAALPGNVENFMGVAQVPIGLAGPILIDGEHADAPRRVPAPGHLAFLARRDPAPGRAGPDPGFGNSQRARQAAVRRFAFA